VKLRIYEANKNWKPGMNMNLDSAGRVVGFAISDSGNRNSDREAEYYFEAFQQAEGSTSRKYGGTGLGLSISRGLAELLGGTIELKVNPEEEAPSTLFLPVENISGVVSRQTGQHESL